MSSASMAMACEELFNDEKLGIVIIEVEIKNSVELTWAWSLSLLLAHMCTALASSFKQTGKP